MIKTIFLDNFKWNTILSNSKITTVKGESLKEVYEFDLYKEDFNIQNQNLNFEKLKLTIEKQVSGKIKVKGVANFSLSETTNEEYAIDCYEGNCDVFFKDLTLFLSSKPVKMTYNTLICDDSVMYEAEIFINELKISDFDCVDDEDGGYTPEEVFEKLEKYGAILKDYTDCGVGGGNPQYFAYFESEDIYKQFIKELYCYSNEEVEEFLNI